MKAAPAPLQRETQNKNKKHKQKEQHNSDDQPPQKSKSTWMTTTANTECLCTKPFRVTSRKERDRQNETKTAHRWHFGDTKRHHNADPPTKTTQNQQRQPPKSTGVKAQKQQPGKQHISTGQYLRNPTTHPLNQPRHTNDTKIPRK